MILKKFSPFQASFGLSRLVLLFCLLLGAQFSFAASSQQGVVLVAAGEVHAKNLAGEERKLLRRSKVAEGDVLVTGADSKLVIRMPDSGTIALAGDSEFKVVDYEYTPSKPKEQSAVYKISRGSARVMTGLIVKEKFKLDTPTSTLGLSLIHI